MDLVLVTSSSSKAREAEEILGRKIERVEIDLPEIQAATAEEIARESMVVAAGICIYTNDNITVESL